MLALVQQGVRHVIPIHLVDNDFGGTAVYSDAFNAVNDFIHSTRDGDGNLVLNGFLKVSYDDKLKFRLGWPMFPRPEGNNILRGGAIHLDPVPQAIWLGLGYAFGGSAGHLNAKGLSTTGKDLIKKLVQMGVMIDMAHMGTQSTLDTLENATRLGYPVMDSHTGFRNADGTADNERALDRDQAKRIGQLGGVIGLGTDGRTASKRCWTRRIYRHTSATAQASLATRTTPRCTSTASLQPRVPGDPVLAHLRFRIVTGADDMSKDLNAVLTIDGKQYTYLLNKFHETWRPGLVTTPTIELPANTESSKLTKITLRIDHGGWWAMDEVQVLAVPHGNDPVSTWLATFKDGLAIMGGKAMAIGTDINGFAPQLYLPADDVQYPIQIAHLLGPAKHTPPLNEFVLGNKTFDFKEDGIAHYGMLPDFMQALAQQPDSSEALDALFHSVNDVVAMWDTCVKVAPTIH